MFLWRFTHNSLPIQTKLARKGVKQVDTSFSVCFRADEDCGHLFFKCKEAKELWRCIHLEELRQSLTGMSSAIEAVTHIMGQQAENRLNAIILMSCWWSARNKAHQGERRCSIVELHNNILYHVQVLSKLQPVSKQHMPSRRSQRVWQPPHSGVYKINCDGAYVKETRAGGWGCMIRDHKGEFLAACAGRLEHVSSELQAEAIYSLFERVGACNKAGDGACDSGN